MIFIIILFNVKDIIGRKKSNDEKIKITIKLIIVKFDINI